MLNSALFVIVCATFALAQDEGMVVSDNKTQCINQMMDWCTSMQYPQQGVGLAVLSVTYEDPNDFYRVFCTADSDGTNCTRNTQPWFTCSPDHVLTYKGQVLSNKTMSTDVDDDICRTADKAFNDLFVQTLSYDNTTLKNEVQKGMESFFQQMAVMQEQIDMIERILRRYVGGFWNGFNDGLQYGGPDFTTIMPDYDTQRSTQINIQSNTDKTNEIEKE